MTRILVTGAAGFIGFHLCRRLLARGDEVVGVDNLNDYYDVALKEARLAQLQGQPGFHFVKLDLADRDAVAGLFRGERFDRVVNLAAGQGHPAAVMDMSFANQVLAVEHLVAHGAQLGAGVHPVPEAVDREVARLKLASLGVEIDALSEAQAAYLRGWLAS